jgi:hypothetical protein
MAANFKSIIEREIDLLFDDPDSTRIDPVTGAVNWAREPIGPQKKAAIKPLLAREWFAVYGPPDAPRLPLSHGDVEECRHAGGLKGIVGFYARSLSRQEYDVRTHPLFDDFARGLMAIDTGLWGIEKNEKLKRRFRPRPLVGMTPGAYWAPPKEYDERYRGAHCVA